MIKYCPNPECPHYVDVGKPAEFLDEIDLCSDCGTRLQWGDENDAVLCEPEPEAPVPWVEVGAFSDSYQAQFAKGRLEAEGIGAMFMNEHSTITEFSNYWGDGQIKLVVREGDAAAARDLLAADYSQAVPGEDAEPEGND